MKNVDQNNLTLISNFEKKKDKDVIKSIREHSNSLNINISTTLLETLTEA
jgi:hypothetical protein